MNSTFNRKKDMSHEKLIGLLKIVIVFGTDGIRKLTCI